MAPELGVDVLTGLGRSKTFFSQRDGEPIERDFVAASAAGDPQHGGCQIRVGAYNVRLVAGWDTGTADDKRDVDIGLIGTFFSWVEAVLGDVVALGGVIQSMWLPPKSHNRRLTLSVE